MCGIAGKLDLRGPVDEALLARMCDVIEHRGPDSRGTYADVMNRNGKKSRKLEFTAAGLPEKMIENVTFSNITAEGNQAGSIEYASNWKLLNVTLKTKSGEAVKISNSQVEQASVK